MNEMDLTPTYNLKVVVQETGVKPDTLRAWERRYGLPQPERTSGRHRLYSQYDIETIKWLVSRQEEGMSISRSVELWFGLIEAGKNPLVEYETYEPPIHDSPPLDSGTNIDEARRAWIAACMEFNEARSEAILTQAFALYPPVLVCLEVLQKGIAEIGSMWYRNEATVQQEHFASALAMRRLNSLVAAAPAPTRPGRIIVACPAHEDHVFAPLMLTLMLRYGGWEVIYLGANVPLNRLETMIQTVKPDLLIMTAQQLYTAANLMQVAELMATQQSPLAYGGRIFNYVPHLRDRIPAHFLGERLEDATRNVAQILGGKVPLPKVEPIPPSYRQALQVYRQMQAAIENRVWQLLQRKDARYEHVTNANIYLSRDIVAALQLGDMTLLGSEISWTEKLLLNYNMPEETLHDYLEAYYQAANEMLGTEGRPIIGWLENLSSTGS